MSEIGNHLWQSTIFAGAIICLCLVLRQHSPRLRYWLLPSASLKFLVPFSLFLAAGRQLQTPVAEPVFTAVTAERASAAFAPMPASMPRPRPVRETSWYVLVWAAGMFLVLAWRLAQWRRIYAIRRGARPVALAFPVPVLLTPTAMEPGVFGVFRSVLLLPEGLLSPGGLSAGQFHAILAHERCHVASIRPSKAADQTNRLGPNRSVRTPPNQGHRRSA